MSKNNLHEKLLELLHQMREVKGESLSVVDITSQLQNILNSDDLRFEDNVRQELHAMIMHIDQSKSEIKQFALESHREKELSEVSNTLDIIVQTTEEATDTILDAAEVIQELLQGSDAKEKDAVLEAAGRIIMACNFQDLTGQRIQNVMQTFIFVENRLRKLNNYLNKIDDGKEYIAEVDDKDPLMNGPATPDEAPSQEDIDALFSSLD